MSSRLELVIAVALAGCHPASTGPRLPHGPLASPLAAWIPSDAALVVVVGDGGSAAVDEVTTALGWIGPGVLAALERSVALAWDDSGIQPRSAMWILWDDEARSTATCTVTGDAWHAADALIQAGGTRQVSDGADLIDLGETTTVIRGDVACIVESGAASRRAHHALRLASLTAEDRLLASSAEVDGLLRALPAADVIVWGKGALVGGLVEVVPGAATEALAVAGTPAIAIGVDPSSHEVRLTIAAPAVAPEADRPTEGTVSPGAFALLPPLGSLSPMTLPPKDENTDVPLSDEYLRASTAVLERLVKANELSQQHAALEATARGAFDGEWGTVTWARRAQGEVELVEATWAPPLWPPAQLHKRAATAMEEALATEPQVRAQYERLVAEATAGIEVMIGIRARDVAAWDRAH